MCEFEKKVLENLKANGISFSADLLLGLAVSGGADSISLLLALSEILFEYKLPLYVITVNHNIRPAEESRGDADYVIKICDELRNKGRNIVCEVVELARGAVEKEEKRRGGGTEDAARHLRYAAFERFISKHKLDALCLAHNRNDQLETILMRFLQGASSDSAAGIKAKRGSFIRPLLNVERSEIEAYLNSKNISWCTDKTNFETEYLRNKIRHKLVPLLNSDFPGWQTAVLNGAERACEDSELIQASVEKVPLTKVKGADDIIKIDFDSFLLENDAVKKRVLLNACNLAGETSRIPHAFLNDVLFSLKRNKFVKSFGIIDICKEKNALFVKKHVQNNTDLVFFDIIEKIGEYEFPFGILKVYNIEESLVVSVMNKTSGLTSFAEGLEFPFCVRSIQTGDTIRTSDGKEKKISDILTDWHVSSESRDFVPVIQQLNEKSQRIKCILAGFLGYKDWIVKV